MYYTTDGFGYVNYVVLMIMICLCVKSLDHEVSFIGQEKNIPLVVHYTPSVPNYRSFDFFHLKFDHSSYSKIYAKYHFFCCGLLHQYKFFNNELNLTMFL